MNDETADGGSAEDIEQWSNTVGDDDELDRLWDALIAATAEAEPKDLEAQLARYLAGLGARSRRTTEGLILAVIAATAAEGAGWNDWRVVLHRHFARDERMDLGVAAAILLEWRKEAVPPDWHSLAEGVTERVFRAYVQDMRHMLELLDKPEETSAAAAGLVALGSELFDVAIALAPADVEELQHSLEATAMLREIEEKLGQRAEGQPRSIANNLAKAQALLEVTLRQLEIGDSVVH